MIARAVPSALLALTLSLSACNKPTVETYRAPKEPVAVQPAEPVAAQTAMPDDAAHAGVARTPTGAPASAIPGGGAMANTAVATAGGVGLTWKAPAHWKTKPGSAMRKGSFTVTAEGVSGEADLAITAFPGDVGGDLANLNRWRGQINLPPIAAADFAMATQKLERNGLKMTVVDLAGSGEKAQRILGAMIPHEGSTWFVKLMGPDAIVAKEKAAFMAFMDTVTTAPAAK